jgi:hypothetical protein
MKSSIIQSYIKQKLVLIQLVEMRELKQEKQKEVLGG